jgi:prepilin peptidase CpaA
MIETSLVERTLALALSAFVVAVGYKDWRERRVPNVLVFPAAALGLGLNALKGRDALLVAATGLAMGFALLFVPYLVGGMRAGDVKLLAAIGAFTGAPQILRVFLLTLLCYPALAVFFVTRERKWKVTLLRFRILLLKTLSLFAPMLRLTATRLEAEDDPKVESVRTPFSLAIATGTLLTLYTCLLAHLL